MHCKAGVILQHCSTVTCKRRIAVNSNILNVGGAHVLQQHGLSLFVYSSQNFGNSTTLYQTLSVFTCAVKHNYNSPRAKATSRWPQGTGMTCCVAVYDPAVHEVKQNLAGFS